jgi:hypothetical protein
MAAGFLAIKVRIPTFYLLPGRIHTCEDLTGTMRSPSAIFAPTHAAIFI